MRPTYAEVEHALLGRWPETRLEPSLDRIRALCDLMGDPQHSYPVIHLTGTNGKTSTSRMIDGLVRALGLRTGRFTSPHLETMRERICVDGEPLSEELFVDAFSDVAAYAQVVDDSSEHPLSFFEMIVAMAYAAFADTPVEVGIVEVGMGGAWDATNVADGQVAVVTPIDVDHHHYLGDSPGAIAVEKSGIIKPRSHVVLAEQQADAADVLSEKVAAVGSTVSREGVDFGLTERLPAFGGQLLTVQGTARSYDEIFLPLYGAHQAHNAAYAIAAVEGFLGGKELDPQLVRDAFAEATSPGRLEVVRRSPTVLLDAAHNPHGMRATVEAVQEAFSLSPLIGVVGVMADKEVDGVLDALEPALSQIVCTQNTTDRAMPAAELGDIAEGIFGSDRVQVVPRLDDAIERGVQLAEVGGVLVTGSVVTAGQARVLLGATAEDASG
ncbi:MAG: bifunctional folylpolyglutamate synthase/dihydrofolate synthase [Nocardioidaceae bacterium]